LGGRVSGHLTIYFIVSLFYPNSVIGALFGQFDWLGIVAVASQSGVLLLVVLAGMYCM